MVLAIGVANVVDVAAVAPERNSTSTELALRSRACHSDWADPSASKYPHVAIRVDVVTVEPFAGVLIVAVGGVDVANTADAENADAVACVPHVATCHSTDVPFAYVAAGRIHDDTADTTAVAVVHVGPPTKR